MLRHKIACFLILLTVAFFCHIVSTQDDGVRLPPVLTKWPRQNEYPYRDGDYLTLDCVAHGTPTPSYEWKKNGFKFNTNLTNIRKGSDGTITINRGTVTDEGYYQCLARNQYGTALSDTIYLRMRLIAPTVISNAGPSTVLRKTVVEGIPFHIEAHRPSISPMTSCAWYTVGKTDAQYYSRLWPSERIEVADNGDLHFAYALPEDARFGIIHRCTHFSRDSTRPARTQLTVMKNSSGDIGSFAPILAFSSEAETVAVVGKDLQLRCFFYGYPAPVISWSGLTNALDTGRYLLSNSNAAFFLRPAAADDEGNYSCTASNEKGNNTLTFRIRVEVEPNFNNTTDGPYNVNATEGESVIFNCNAYADPQANISWLQNGQLLNSDNPPERFVFSNDLKSLTIRDVCRDCVDRESKTDLMVIQCNASNVHGYAFAQGYLNVLRKIDVAIKGSGNVSVDFLEEKQFVFRCDVVSDPSRPATVRWYKTEPFGDLVHDEPPHVYVMKDILVIMIDSKCSVSNCSKYLGEYRCVGDDGYNQEYRTITLHYQYKSPTEPHTTKEDPSAEWRIYLGAGAMGLVPLLIGIFIFFHSRRLLAINTREKDNELPNPSITYDCIGYDSVNLPLKTESDNNKSMRKTCSVYEHVGYDSIDQVLKEMATREGTVVHAADVTGYNKYETVDASEKEAIRTGRRMLEENIMYADAANLNSLDDVTSDWKFNQQEINGHELVQSESGKFKMSNEQPESMNTYSYLNREDGNSKPDLGNRPKDLRSEEVASHGDLVSEEMNQYLDLVSNNVNQYLDLVANNANQYLDLVSNDVNQSLDLVANDVNQSLDLVSNDANKYLDLVANDANQNLDLVSNGANQNLDLVSNNVNQYLDLVSNDANQYLDLVSNDANQNLDLVTNDENQNLDLVSNDANQYLDLVSNDANQYLDLVSNDANQNLDLVSNDANQYLDLVSSEVNQTMDLAPIEAIQNVNLGTAKENECRDLGPMKEGNPYLDLGLRAEDQYTCLGLIK